MIARQPRDSRARRLVLASPIAAGASILLPLTSLAQLTPSPARPGTLQPIDQGIADRGPLSVGRQSLQRDLRTSDDFRNLYTFDRRDVFGARESMFFRRSGAVTAVFPRSAYVQTRRGTFPAIPAGTVFYLGEPPELVRPRTRGADVVSPNFVNLSASHDAAPRWGVERQALEVATPKFEAHRADAVPGPAQNALLAQSETLRESMKPHSIWQDDQYRSERASLLLRRAMERPTKAQAN